MLAATVVGKVECVGRVSASNAEREMSYSVLRRYLVLLVPRTMERRKRKKRGE